MEERFRFCFFLYTFCILDCSFNNVTLQNFLSFRFGFSILRASKLQVPTSIYLLHKDLPFWLCNIYFKVKE